MCINRTESCSAHLWVTWGWGERKHPNTPSAFFLPTLGYESSSLRSRGAHTQQPQPLGTSPYVMPLQPVSHLTLHLLIHLDPSPFHPHSSLTVSSSFKPDSWLLLAAFPKSHSPAAQRPLLWVPRGSPWAPPLHLACCGGRALSTRLRASWEQGWDPIHFTTLGPHPGPSTVRA